MVQGLMSSTYKKKSFIWLAYRFNVMCYKENVDAPKFHTIKTVNVCVLTNWFIPVVLK